MTLFDKARQAFSSTPRLDPDLQASLLLHIGHVKLLQGELDAAFAELQQAQAAKPNKPKLSYVLTALGDSWRRRGDLPTALKSYQAALGMQIEIEDHRGQAITHEKIGEMYAALGNPQEAFKEYQAALTLWRAVSEQRRVSAKVKSIGRHRQKGKKHWRRGSFQ